MLEGQTAVMNFPFEPFGMPEFPTRGFPGEMPPSAGKKMGTAPTKTAGAATQYRSLRSKLIPCCGVVAARLDGKFTRFHGLKKWSLANKGKQRLGTLNVRLIYPLVV